MAVPKLRFPEFTDDWEQRKLGDLYTERNERGNGSLQILSVSIHTGVSDGELDVDNLGKFVRRSEDKSTYKHVHSGDLIFNMMRAWQGAIGVAKTEGMISPAYISAIPSEDIYPPFMNYLLRRKDVINQINNLSYGVTDFRKRLYWNSFVQVNCKLPSVEEQRNITDVFEKIDHLITLHQRKLDDIKLLKKSMLQKMFPAEGRDVPEVRFPGFTAAWEQRKLGDIVERVTRKNTNLESDLPLTISAQYGLIDQNEFFDKRVASKDVSGYYLVNNGEFAYNKSTSNDAPWGAVKRLDRYEKGVVSTLYIVFGIRDSHQTDSDFLATYYDTNRWYSGVQAVAAEGARNHGLLNIAASDFFDTTLMLPASIEEQQRIGAFFKSLDNAITLHQRKCGDLKELKRVAFNGISLKSPGRRRIWHNGIL
ncbi:MAG: restriction endonuclease subunit S [Lachnospiraceae bacterium]|nr:restriction endonuclease subunit S [Lachnospiraceae bacterium]